MSKLKVNEIYKHSGSQVTIVDALSTAGVVTLGNTVTFSEDVTMDKDLGVTGNLNVVGTATISGGAINIGDADSDRLSIRADITSNILPDASNTYDLGAPGKKWNYVHASTLSATAVSITSVDASTGNFTTDVTVGGTVDGRDVSVDGTALDVVKAASGTWDTAYTDSQANETTLAAGSANWNTSYTDSQANETTLAAGSANWDSTYNQVQDASTDLNVDSGTLFVDKSENKVGILTTSPDAVLDVKGTGAADNQVLRFSLDGDRDWIFAQEGSGTGTSLRLRSTAAKDFYIDATATIFRKHDGSGEVMRIEPTNGKVGIGTASPSEKLTVTGTVSAQGFKTDGGTGVTTTVAVSTNAGPQTLTIKNGIITSVA